jgi:hypothetical protein
MGNGERPTANWVGGKGREGKGRGNSQRVNGKRDERRGTGDGGRGKREEGRGKREEGQRHQSVGGPHHLDSLPSTTTNDVRSMYRMYIHYGLRLHPIRMGGALLSDQ